MTNILIVGEAYGAEESEQNRPFVGVSGQELTRMLHDAGIARDDCYITNVVNARPPNNDISKWFLDKKMTVPGVEIQQGLLQLQSDINRIKPNLVIALGNTPLYALTGNRGIVSWRGSILEATQGYRGVKVIPTYHPAAILRQWDWRFIAVHDLRRCAREALFPDIRPPKWNFTLRPNFATVMETLSTLHALVETRTTRLSADIETRLSFQTCFGIAWSPLDAICIPWTSGGQSYWTLEEELQIVLMLRRIFHHPNCQLVGQNFLYDNQYLARDWGFAPMVYMDTMIAHHVCWPGMPKGLDFLSSMYCAFHRYWKDDGKHWDPRKHTEEQYWKYNCEDAARTFEVSLVLENVIDKLNLRIQFEWQMRTLQMAFHMMLRGVAIDTKLKNDFVMELMEHSVVRQQQINVISGHNLNPNSPKQLQEFFYNELKLPLQRNRKTGKPSCDEEALKILANKEPLVRRLVYSIIEFRSLNTSLSVVRTPLDTDGKMRTSYNVAGTETFRFSSSENAFGNGTNNQNITSGKKSEETGLQLPNLRRLFIPDKGFIIVDVDLDRADLQVVVWEADDAGMKEALKKGVDMHLYNVRDLYNIDIPDDEIIETNPACDEHKLRYAVKRHQAKEFVHATDYGGKARTVSFLTGQTVHETELAQRRWFAAHPGILTWHKRTEHQLNTTRTVHNAFGYRRFYFDRVESLLGEALAWIPQSTVALVINRGLIALDEQCPDIHILLQVHDSGTLQLQNFEHRTRLAQIKPLLLIPVPYPDPLIIPVGFKTSEKSWGDVKGIQV